MGYILQSATSSSEKLNEVENQENLTKNTEFFSGIINSVVFSVDFLLIKFSENYSVENSMENSVKKKHGREKGEIFDM